MTYFARQYLMYCIWCIACRFLQHRLAMTIELHHFFPRRFWCWELALSWTSWGESKNSCRTGQENRRFFVKNSVLELLYVCDASEAKNESAYFCYRSANGNSGSLEAVEKCEGASLRLIESHNIVLTFNEGKERQQHAWHPICRWLFVDNEKWRMIKFRIGCNSEHASKFKR